MLLTTTMVLMNKNMIGTSFLALSLLGGLSFGAYLLLHHSFAAQKPVRQNLTQNQTEKDEKQAQRSPASSGGSLSVKGLNSEPASAAPRVPLPNEFKVYEQYATATATQFQDIVVGNGENLEVGDTAVVVYSGWLTDGTLFDQSRKNELGQIEGFPVTIGAGQVIRGWEEGLLGMKAGGTRRLIIPSSLGYGETGQGPIPPNAMLIFDIQLAQIQKPQP